jgi:hypothetical protein
MANRQERVSAPVATTLVGQTVSRAAVKGNPYTPHGRTIIKHTEYLCDATAINTTGGTTNTISNGYNFWHAAIQPGYRAYYGAPSAGGSYVDGVLAMFPWLYSLCQQYQQYRFRRLSFRLEPESSSAVAGTYMMAFDTNCTDNYPASKTELMMFPGAVRTAPWVPARITLDPQQYKNVFSERFIRGVAAQAVVSPLNQYDMGNLYVMTAGVVPGVAMEVYVDYEVELFNPVSIAINPYSMQGSQSSFGTGAIPGGGQNVSFLSALAAVGAPDPQRPQVLFSANVITFKAPGRYLINSIIAGVSLNVTQPALTASAGLTAYSESFVSNQSTAAAWVTSVNVTSANATLTFLSGTFTGGTTATVIVTQFDPTGTLA